jgi:hypothetical protein
MFDKYNGNSYAYIRCIYFYFLCGDLFGHLLNLCIVESHPYMPPVVLFSYTIDRFLMRPPQKGAGEFPSATVPYQKLINTFPMSIKIKISQSIFIQFQRNHDA